MRLNILSNKSYNRKKCKRVGRGIGSGVGKTSGRGEKGAGSRSGYKRRHTYEGGQFRLFMKLPIRGFSNARFQKKLDAINLDQIDKLYSDGEIVNIDSLKQHGYLSGKTHGIKILGKGQLTKKVTIEAGAMTKGARDKLQKAKIPFTVATDKQQTPTEQ